MPSEAGEIGKHLALIAAVAAAMQLFLSSTLHAQVEALQASGLVPSRYGGVAASILGLFYGFGVGLLAVFSTSNNDWILLGVGVLAGLVTGGGAIKIDQQADGLIARQAEKANVTKPKMLMAGELIPEPSEGPLATAAQPAKVTTIVPETTSPDASLSR